MEDGEIRIDTTIDDSGVDSGLKKINKKLKSFGDKLKSSGLSNLGSSITGIIMGASASMKVLSTSVNAVTKAVKETTQAYKTQQKAEMQLDMAVKNSPFLNGQSAQKLKEFSGEIQKYSTYGDEYILPFMAELVNSGRTVEETMDIIQTATDISASGMMDFGTAVSSLNATFQGVAGTLGRQIASIKNLTAEELKSGKAIEILKKQFSGTAEEVAKSVGSSEQLKNAWGDLKEEIGAGWEKPLSKVRGWLKGILEDITNAKKEIRTLKDATDNVNSGNGGIVDYAKLIEDDEKKLELLRSGLNTFKNKSKGIGLDDSDIMLYGGEYEASAQFKKELEDSQAEIKRLKAEIEEYTNILNDLKKAEEEVTEQLKKKSEQEKTQKEIQEELDKSTTHYYQIIAKRDQTIKNIENEANALGEEVDQQAILNAEVTAYLEMASDPNLPTMTQKQLDKVKELVEKTKLLAIEESKRTEFMDALADIDLSSDLKKSEILKEQLDTLTQLNDAFVQSANFEKLNADEKAKIWSEYSQKREQLEKNITKAVEEENAKQKLSLQETTSLINDYVSQISEVISSMSDLAQKHAEDEATVKNAEITRQFKDGLLTEEEYYKKKEEIEKDSARKNYELQMWEWSANLAQIGSSTAQAISNALAMSGHPAIGIAMASVMGTLGAVQLANAIRNKPIPPSFAGGGIVQGGAYSTGDNIRANVKTGEMILNQRQQQNLWRMAQGGGRNSGLQNNIEIKNYRGNDTSVQPQITEDGMKIFIRKSVADDLEHRRLNQPLLSAENTMNGLRYE